MADSESIAAAVGGLAVSNSTATADGVLLGRATSRSTSTSLSHYGTAISDSVAASNGYFGGHAVSVSDSIAEGLGGVARTDSHVVSDARYFARASSNGIGVSRSGLLYTNSARVQAVSRATHGGVARSNVAVIRVLP